MYRQMKSQSLKRTRYIIQSMSTLKFRSKMAKKFGYELLGVAW